MLIKTSVGIVICDDDHQFSMALRTNIRHVLKAHKMAAVIHIFDEAESISDQILSSADIFFLDIDFCEKEYNGIDIARKIHRQRQDSIIIGILEMSKVLGFRQA